MLVVIDETCPVERRRLMPLIEAGRDTGIFFLWVTSARHRLPKACGAVVEIDPDHVTARTGFTGSGLTIAPTRWEGMSLVDAAAVARDITPIIDITGRINDDSEIPSAVAFAELYGGTHILDDPSSILELWQQHEGGHASSEHGLRVVVGMQAGAPFVLDVRQDGPHALVAGTTGAGKSEFLQSFVVGLATMHSPERVTFLLVDYKGGAAFKECVALPHTVGLVTDLDRNEVRRALISLNAELHHRELLLQKADAKDLLEMERKGHPDTPPSLLIVVDEFAALAKEVPEFVDGVVDVALRGTQPRAPPGPGHAAAGRRDHRADPGQHEPAHRPADGRRRRVGRRRRFAGRGGHRTAAARAGPSPGSVPRSCCRSRAPTSAGTRWPTSRPRWSRLRLFGFDHDTAVAEERRVDRAAGAPERPAAARRRPPRGVRAARRAGAPPPVAARRWPPATSSAGCRAGPTSRRSCSASATSPAASCRRWPTSDPTPTAAC